MVTVNLFMFIRVHLIQVLSIEFPYVPLHDLLTSPDMPLYDLLTSPDVPLHDLLTSPDEHAGLKYATQVNIICFLKNCSDVINLQTDKVCCKCVL